MTNNKKGIALLITIAFVFALFILVAALLMISTGHFGTSFHQMERARAFYAAEAALQHVVWKLRENEITPPQNDIPFPEDINRIKAGDIDIDILQKDLPGHPPGVYPINITVTY